MTEEVNSKTLQNKCFWYDFDFVGPKRMLYRIINYNLFRFFRHFSRNTSKNALNSCFVLMSTCVRRLAVYFRAEYWGSIANIIGLYDVLINKLIMCFLKKAFQRNVIKVCFKVQKKLYTKYMSYRIECIISVR